MTNKKGNGKGKSNSKGKSNGKSKSEIQGFFASLRMTTKKKRANGD